MLYRKTGIALGLAGAVALSTVTPSMASVPTAVAAIKDAPSSNTIDVRWGWGHRGGWWGPGIGVGIGLGLLGAAAIASSPYYYGGYGCPYGYYGGYYGCGYRYAGYYGGYGYPYSYGYSAGYGYPYGYGYGGYYARPYYGGWGWRRHWRHW
jgi:hypothetical protein